MKKMKNCACEFKQGCGFILNFELIVREAEWARKGKDVSTRELLSTGFNGAFSPEAVGLEGTKKKHKKNKRKRCTVESLDVPDVEESVLTHRPIKLKIKLGDQLISSSETTM